MLCKFGSWNWRDTYRLPLSLLLWPLVSFNYWQRENGIKPDEWYWADAMLFHYGYCVMHWRAFIWASASKIKWRVRDLWWRIRLYIATHI